MKTDELVAMLAAGAAPVDPDAITRRYATAIGWGAFGATLLMMIALGARPDLSEAARLPMFWIKFAFPACVAVAALYAAARLSRPGARLGRAPAALAAPVLVIWAMAAYALASAAGPDRAALMFGESSSVCTLIIAILSLPVFAAALWAMRGLAPTRPALAGAATGLLAGAIGALVYAFHCTEMDVPFLAFWYSFGMLIPAAAGTLIGPWLLRW